jgi:hypothetical protein
MGFIVKQTIETIDGNQYDEFYVRIESYQIFKIFGDLGVTVAHYDSPESAKKSIPDYLEDSPTGKHGPLNVNFSYNGESKEWPMWYSFPLVEKVEITETKYNSTWAPEVVEYIDFDENGDEIIKTREEWFESITSEIVVVEKTKKNINLIEPDLYTYAYDKIKAVYADVFGLDNITDSI